MQRFALIALLAAVVLRIDPCAAQTVSAVVDVDSISIGERTDLVIRIVHDGARRAVFPDETGGEVPPESIGLAGDFELIGRRRAGFRVLSNAMRLDSVVYDAATFALDQAGVVPVVGLATESDTVFVAGDSVVVPVRSVVPEEASDILDITPVAEFPRTWWPWLLAVAVLAAGYLLWRRFRPEEEEEREPEPEPEPEEPPLDEALRRLSALAATDLSTDAALKPFFVELSDILRTYVARRTGVPARELTTAELVAELQTIRDSVHLSDDRLGDLDRLLRAADLVKFADYHPPTERARSALDETTLAVRSTEEDLRRPVDAASESNPAP